MLIHSWIVSILWGLYDHIDKKILKELTYRDLYIVRGAYRSIFLCIAIGIFMLVGGKVKKDIDREIKWYILATIVIGIVSIVLELYVFERNKISSSVGVMGGLYIVSTVLMGRYLFGEKLTTREMIGILVILCGVYIVSGIKN